MAYFILARFRDKAKTMYVSRSSDVREFETQICQHPDDFVPDRRYGIHWQEGEGSFDGYYDATIICMAASLPELKQKAAEKNIRRMPPNYHTLLKSLPEEGKEQKEDTSSKRKVEKTLGRRARMDRMNGTLDDCIAPPKKPCRSSKRGAPENEKSTPPCNESSGLPPSKKSSALTSTKISPVQSSGSLLPEKPSCEFLLEKTFKKDSLSPSYKKFDRSPSFKGGDPLNLNRDYASEDDSYLEEEIANPGSPLQNKNDGEQLESEEDEESKKETGSDMDSKLKTALPTDRKFDTLSDSGSEDSTSKLMDQLQELNAQLKHASLEIDSLKAGLKLSEESRKKTLIENKKLKENAEQMTTEIHQLQDSGKKLSAENKRLRTLITNVREALRTESQSMSTLVKSYSNLARSKPSEDLTQSTPQRDDRKGEESSPKAVAVKTLQCNTKVTKADLKTNGEKDCPPKAEAVKTLEFNSKVTKADLKTDNGKKSAPKAKDERGLSSQQIKDIGETIRKDLTGEELFEPDETGQVALGPHIKIPAEKWKYIKTQTKNSLFIKKLAAATYGSEGLKKRTVGKAKEDTTKQMATPVKVDTFVAALRGKLLSENPKTPNIDAAAGAARTLLANKMQDEARPIKVKKTSVSPNSKDPEDVPE